MPNVEKRLVLLAIAVMMTFTGAAAAQQHRQHQGRQPDTEYAMRNTPSFHRFEVSSRCTAAIKPIVTTSSSVETALISGVTPVYTIE